MQENKRGSKEVTAFAKAMIYNLNLKKNAIKGDWRDNDWKYLLNCLKEETLELQIECIKHQTHPTEEIKKRIRSEAADTACFAMMLADKFESLNVQPDEGGIYEKIIYACNKFAESFRRWLRRRSNH